MIWNSALLFLAIGLWSRLAEQCPCVGQAKQAERRLRDWRRRLEPTYQPMHVMQLILHFSTIFRASVTLLMMCSSRHATCSQPFIALINAFRVGFQARLMTIRATVLAQFYDSIRCQCLAIERDDQVNLTAPTGRPIRVKNHRCSRHCAIQMVASASPVQLCKIHTFGAADHFSGRRIRSPTTNADWPDP